MVDGRRRRGLLFMMMIERFGMAYIGGLCIAEQRHMEGKFIDHGSEVLHWGIGKNLIYSLGLGD